MKPKPIFYFLLICSLARVYPAFSHDIYFNRVLPPEGKTFVHVSGMVQDAQGYMWLSTKENLFRYDSYNMILYKHNPADTNSLSTNALEAICIDKNGFFWIATQGIERFNPATGVFTNWLHNANDSGSLNADWVSTVMADKAGNFWVGAKNGLDRFDERTGNFHDESTDYCRCLHRQNCLDI